MTNISFEKSVDVVRGIRTQDRRMVVADEGKLLLLFHIEIVVKEIVDVSCFVIKRDLRWAGVVPSFTQFALLTELWRPPQIEEFLLPVFPEFSSLESRLISSCRRRWWRLWWRRLRRRDQNSERLFGQRRFERNHFSHFKRFKNGKEFVFSSRTIFHFILVLSLSSNKIKLPLLDI